MELSVDSAIDTKKSSKVLRVTEFSTNPTTVPLAAVMGRVRETDQIPVMRFWTGTLTYASAPCATVLKWGRSEISKSGIGHVMTKLTRMPPVVKTAMLSTKGNPLILS